MRKLNTPEFPIVVAVLALFALCAVPLTPAALDILIATNLGFAVFLFAMVLSRPADRRFTTFPAILLGSTVFRLGLNIASTRLILTTGTGGEVIDAFGRGLVQGNPIVGMAIFIIMAVIVYLVVAKGAERASEVAARFALDGLPGAQIAVESELRGGLIDADEARRRRAEVELDARLRGSMDGAMKVVKGDTIAGVLITAVNLVAGAAIGVAQLGLSPVESVQTFTVLTIGDGLVAQIPALLSALAATFFVTSNTVGGRSLVREVVTELQHHRGPLLMAAVAVAIVGLIPGLPFWPLMLVAAAAFGLWRLSKGVSVDAERAPVQEARLQLLVPESLAAELEASAVRHRLLQQPRKTCLEALGVHVPPITVGVRNTGRGTVQLCLDRVPLAQTEDGDLDAWLSATIRQHAHEFVCIDDVAVAVHELRQTDPTLVQTAEEWLTVAKLTDVLRRVVEEGVSIRNLRRIMDGLVLTKPDERSVDDLVAAARRALRREVWEAHQRAFSRSGYWEVDRELADTLLLSLRQASTPYFAISGGERAALLDQVKDLSASGELVLVTDSRVRRPLWELIRSRAPHAAVLSTDEVGDSAAVRHGWISLG